MSPKPPTTGIAKFHGQIDLPVIRQAVVHLRQELDSQKTSIVQTRRRLPRGWYRQSNPTVNLEIVSNVLPARASVQLPNIWPACLIHGKNS